MFFHIPVIVIVNWIRFSCRVKIIYSSYKRYTDNEQTMQEVRLSVARAKRKKYTEQRRFLDSLSPDCTKHLIIEKL